MTAQVEILVTQLDNVVSVPVQAVVQAQGKDFVFVLTPEGPVRRPVVLGITNQKLIEVKEGIKEGEEVALNWSALMTEQEKNALFSSSKSTTKSKDWANAPPPGNVNLPTGLNGLTGKADAGQGRPQGQGGDPKAKGKGQAGRGGMGAGGFKMFPDDPALQAKVDKIPQEKRRSMRTATEEEKAAILKEAGFTDEDTKKYEDAMAQMMERMKNMPPGGFGGGGGGGGFGGGGGGPGGGGGFGGPGGGGPGGGGPPGGGGGIQ